MQDSSVIEVRNDKGIQGIPKERVAIPTETTRQRKLQCYKKYENIPQSGILGDSKNGEVVYPLCGHVDYSFESAWHPDGLIFASGN
ncbi:hypothetical protein H5410_004454 [Solanum commersonii]|uniref:Uncharacterized protein n=1 Tax=Solanum commersonii TaxID=4109 RepID=A0A9J6B7U2_SOLCO|nr:hypothetical protein H5410_004454 [Solanum commersonii]